jgi:hypothetical protein
MRRPSISALSRGLPSLQPGIQYFIRARTLSVAQSFNAGLNGSRRGMVSDEDRQPPYATNEDQDYPSSYIFFMSSTRARKEFTSETGSITRACEPKLSTQRSTSTKLDKRNSNSTHPFSSSEIL